MEQVKEWELQFRFQTNSNSTPANHTLWLSNTWTFLITLHSVRSMSLLGGSWSLVKRSIVLIYIIWCTLDLNVYLAIINIPTKCPIHKHFRGAATATKSLMKKRKLQPKERRKPSEKTSNGGKAAETSENCSFKRQKIHSFSQMLSVGLGSKVIRQQSSHVLYM